MMKRPILYIVIPFCFGIAISRFLKIPIAYPVILSIAFIAIALLKSRKNIFSHLALYFAVFFFGIAAYQNSVQLPPDHISRYAQDIPQKVFIKGVVADDPITSSALYGKKKTTFTLKAEEIKKKDGEGAIGGGEGKTRLVEGLARVTAYSDKEMPISFADKLVMEGLLSKPQGLKNPGIFDYEEYMAIKDIHAVLRVKEDSLIKKIEPGSYAPSTYMNLVQKTAYKLRHHLRNLFDKYLEPRYSGFMKAILIGDRTGLDDNLKDDFVKTGTVHILAISGLHVGLIAAIVMAFFGILRFPKKLNLTMTLIFLVFYSFAAGSNTPIIRATIMFAIIAIGYLINRDTDTLNSLSLAAFLILLWNPKELFDPSFQLSFASVASIIIFVPKINEFAGLAAFGGNSIFQKTGRYLYTGIATSIAAWIGTWPIILSYFNIVSPISIIANLVIIPILFILMVVTFIFILANYVWIFFSLPLAQLLCGIERALFWANHFFANIPFSYFRGGMLSLPFFILYYALISLPLIPSVVEFKRLKVRRRHILLAVLLFFNILVWGNNVNAGRKNLEITFLDVGQGDSIFIKLPRGSNILIDGGPGGEEGKYDTGKSVVAPYLWNRGVKKIDAVIVTHFHADHLGGLIYILKNFKVGCVIDSGTIIENGAVYDEYKRVVRDRGIKHFAVGEGDVIDSPDGVKFFVLNPPGNNNLPKMLSEENDDSVVLKLVYKNFSCMLCGDATAGAISRFLSYDSFLKSDVVKIPHHGGHLGNEEIISDFFDKVSPQICVTSVGIMDRYNTAALQKNNYIKHLNSVSYETKNDGAITILQ